jgi:hypothetical protein
VFWTEIDRQTEGLIERERERNDRQIQCQINEVIERDRMTDRIKSRHND